MSKSLRSQRNLSAAGGFRRWSTESQAGFTLIELLVSMIVLVLLVVMVTQVVGGASATSNLQRGQLDADRQARLIFDRMAADFAGMVRRADVDCSAYRYANYRTGSTAHFKRAGNDSLLFFSEADSQSTGSALSSEDALSVVGYRVFDNPAAQPESACYKLERLGQAISWSDPTTTPPGQGLPFLTFDPITPTNVVLNSTLTTYWSTLDEYNAAGQNTLNVTQSHVLGQDVFRLEFAVQMKNIQSNNTYFLQSDSTGIGYLPYASTTQGAFSGVSAIVVTIATLDAPSRTRLGSGNALYQALNTVVGKLGDGDDATVATKWMTELTTDTSIPRVVATNAHVYQRYFYLR